MLLHYLATFASSKFLKLLFTINLFCLKQKFPVLRQHMPQENITVKIHLNFFTVYEVQNADVTRAQNTVGQYIL